MGSYLYFPQDFLLTNARKVQESSLSFPFPVNQMEPKTQPTVRLPCLSLQDLGVPTHLL